MLKLSIYLSISQSKEIGGIQWCDVRDSLHNTFKNSDDSIIICLDTVKYVPEKDRDKIFQELHCSPIGGHKGVNKTFNRIKRHYYWENLKDDIQKRIQQCLDCQLGKLTRVKTRQPLVITDTPGIALDKIAMDIVGPLPKTKAQNEYILTMQDQLSKLCVAVPFKDATASSIADAFIKRWICVYGSPRIILTDQGQNFLSTLLKRIAKRFKIKQVKTTAFHPQSNSSL